MLSRQMAIVVAASLFVAVMQPAFAARHQEYGLDLEDTAAEAGQSILDDARSEVHQKVLQDASSEGDQSVLDEAVTDAQAENSLALAGGGCDLLDKSKGWKCSVLHEFSNGVWGNTQKVRLEKGGFKIGSDEAGDFVLKAASHASKRVEALEVLRNEIAVAHALQQSRFPAMARHYFDFPLQSRVLNTAAVFYQEFLNGYQDATGFKNDFWISQEDGFRREVRAASMFLGYKAMLDKKVSHCDLNAGNVMFKVDDPTKMKFIDFGFAERRALGDGLCTAPEDGPFSNRDDDMPNLSTLYRKISTMEEGPSYVPFSQQCDFPSDAKQWRDWENSWTCIVNHAQTLIGAYGS